MVGIVYATQREAQPFLSRISAESLSNQPLVLYQTTVERHPKCIVAISGMGKVAATMAAAHLVLVHRVVMLVNAGLCGRLAMVDDLAVGDLLRISSAVEGDGDCFDQPEPCAIGDSQWFGQLKAARLVTCDRPVFDAARRVQLAAMGDVADMEGAAVTRVAGLYSIPWAMVKGISDLADESGRQDVAANIDRVSGRIATVLAHELETKATAI